MATLGRVAEIWRYPVKSMRGESLENVNFGIGGITGDRGWAIRDEKSGEIRGAKKFPKLMQCEARYAQEPQFNEDTGAQISLPNGERFSTLDDKANTLLSKFLDAEVSLHGHRPASDLEHYKRQEALDEQSLRDLLSRNSDEPLPDLSTFPPDVLQEISEYTSPRGTYFDAFPVHILTTSWLKTLASKNPDSQFAPARFRPNLLIDGAADGYPENDWCGKTIRIGDAALECVLPTVRCGMTTHATGELPKDTQVLRTIVKNSEQNVGAYANVVQAGEIKIGDSVELL
ncbi:MAG: MOSC N-terminal beta barrel domain-containing protein [Pseudomonadota bacterium]